MERGSLEALSLNRNLNIPSDLTLFESVFIDDLKKSIPEIYLDDSVIDFFKQLLPGKCNAASIEYPYYDSDYLSIYYSHYARSFRPYKRECCRVVLYGLDNSCVGYITLRPLPKMKKIGKTYLDPIVFAKENCYIICGQYKVHFQGAEATIEAMPYMQQEKSVAVCAHICLWSTIRFFASRFTNRANQTIGDIVEHVESPAVRKIPSNGLTPTQISSLLINSGFSSIILRRDSQNADEAPLAEQLCAYLDSGLPVICISSSLTHAVVACGRTPVSREKVCTVDSGLIKYLGVGALDGNKEAKASLKLAFESSMIDSIIVNDDNELPYNNVSLKPRFDKGDSRRLLQFSQIDVCVVPLDGEMNLSYSAAKDIMQLIFYQRDNHGRYVYAWQEDTENIVKDKERIHFSKISLVSSNTCKEWIRENIDSNKLPCEFNVLLWMDYPKFLWLCEFAAPSEYCEGNCSGFILLDPTCTSTDTTACLVVADNRCCRICRYTSESEKEIMHAFDYESKFAIPLFRKNYVEVIRNEKSKE